MKLAFAILGVAATLAAAGRAAADMQFRTYRSAKYGYSLAVPSEWEMHLEKDQTITFTGSTGVLVISIRPRAGCTAEGLPKYAAQFVLSDKVKVLHQGKRTANSSPGWLYQYQTKDASDTLRGDTICLLNEDSLYIIAFVTRDWLYDASHAVFEKALAALKLFPPSGAQPLAQGYRRFVDTAGGFRLQLPATWQATSEDATSPAFAGDDGTLQIMLDDSARYLPGDVEILAKAYVERAHYKLASLAPGRLDGQMAEFAYCEPPDKPEWGACFIVFVRQQRLHIIKIAYQRTTRKDVVQQIAGSFQFLPAAKAKAGAKISQVPKRKSP